MLLFEQIEGSMAQHREVFGTMLLVLRVSKIIQRCQRELQALAALERNLACPTGTTAPKM